jgi:hypothetical protein
MEKGKLSFGWIWPVVIGAIIYIAFFVEEQYLLRTVACLLVLLIVFLVIAALCVLESLDRILVLIDLLKDIGKHSYSDALDKIYDCLKDSEEDLSQLQSKLAPREHW